MFKNRLNKLLCFFIISILVITAFSNIAISDDSILPFPIDIIDFDGDTDYLIDIQSITPISLSESFLLYDNQPEGFGGYFADCEKSPIDGGNDDLCCWAATAANMLEWTGWGFVSIPGTSLMMDNTDDFLHYFNTYTSAKGSLSELALEWWFNGTLTCPNNDDWSEEEIDGYGGFWSESDFTNNVLWTYDEPNNVQQIDEWLHMGYAVGITIHNRVTGGGGHCITVWGYEYDLRYDSENPHDYYLGLYASDSDDNKNLENPPDRLKYVKLSYNTSGDFWQFGSYKISGVTALKPFPDHIRPIANAGGIYLKEGTMTTVDLDGSDSVNSNSPGVPLQYRWDFTNDGTWDTPWSPESNAFYEYDSSFDGKAKLEVFDGRLRDVDFAYIRDVTITPTLIETLTLPKELFVLQKAYSFRANYYDSILTNFYEYYWNFDDGSNSDKPIVKHTFANPGTYDVTLTINYGAEVINIKTISITVKSANDFLVDLNDKIHGIDVVFDKNPDQRKIALEGMLINDEDSVLNLINSGLFVNASEKLQMIKMKMDGDKKPKDWIINPLKQTELCSIIDDLILYCII